MDPWQPCEVSNSISVVSDTNVVDLASEDSLLHNENIQKLATDQHQPDETSTSNTDKSKHSSQCENQGELSFGDNFQPFVKLPDSQEYLDSLERKLKIIQKGGRKGPSADSILKSLGQTKESCMLKLLSNSVEKLSVEGEIYEELKVNPLLKKLAPEKQALSAEELVHLLKADQLEILLGGGNNNNEEESSEPTVAATESTAESNPITELKSSTETEKDVDSSENQTSSKDLPSKQE